MNILTWNMQGYMGSVEKPDILVNFLNDGFYDVVCVQEATQPLGSFKCVGKKNDIEVYKMPDPYNKPRSSNKITDYTAFYYQWGNANFRCSLTTYVKDFTSKDFFGVFIDNEFEDARQMLYVTHYGVYIGNIHLISGNPNAAFKQFNNFKTMMSQLPNNPPFCIIGDYNIDALTDQKIRKENKFYYIQEPTQQSDGCLDYMYAELFSPKKIERIDEPGKYSDHSPVSYIF